MPLKGNKRALLPLGCCGFLIGSCLVAEAVQLQDGTVYFATPPALVAATSTFKAVYSPSIYFFTVQVPATAGEPLQQITLNQESGSEAIVLNPAGSYAYEGTRDREGQKLPATVTQDAQTRVISAIFSPPVNPGTLVTLALRPLRNPSVGGIYQFKVTTFPAGEKAYGQTIGYGRLQFYSGAGGGVR
jgi:hypothetical protein